MIKIDFKLITYNFLFLFLFLFLIEATLGKWRSNRPAYDIPFALVDKNIKYDGSKIYGEGINSQIKYSRDKDGYRSFANKKANNLILTVGGSTTDQRYVPDGLTFQDIMNKELGKNFAVINGGVDGQTSLGHFISIRDWHSKVLDKRKIKKVIYYVGLNDIRFANFGLEVGLKIKAESRSFIENLRSSYLWQKASKRSYFYYWARRIKHKFFEQEAADGIKTIGHGTVNPKFLDDDRIYNFENFKLVKESEDFIKLTIKLINETYKAFPDSEIIFIQQPDAKCKFKNKYKVASRTTMKMYSQNTLIDHCKMLGRVYLAQDKAFSLIKDSDISNKLKVIKMYIEAPIPSEGYYDGVHTNIYGSKVLGKYILKALNF